MFPILPAAAAAALALTGTTWFMAPQPARTPTDLVVMRVSFAPGTVTPWHVHPGAALVAVRSGTLTFVRSTDDGCTTSRYPAGRGFRSPAGEVQLARNDGHRPAVVVVTFTRVPVGGEVEEVHAAPSGRGCPKSHAEEEDHGDAHDAAGISAKVIARGTLR